MAIGRAALQPCLHFGFGIHPVAPTVLNVCANDISIGLGLRCSHEAANLARDYKKSENEGYN